MRIDVITLFPGMFEGPLTESILGRARKDEHVEINIHDLRQFGEGTHKQVDDRPYGGGAGMLLQCEPIVKMIESIQESGPKDTTPHRIFLTPRGTRLIQAEVENLAKHKWLILLCGHYEGIDQRIIDGGWIDSEISIGDYVLTGGELPAMVLIDAVSRHLPGVLGDAHSAAEESFSLLLENRREYPQYTRPPVFRGLEVPKILQEGNHGAIAKWRKENLL